MNVHVTALIDGMITPDYRVHIDLSSLAEYLLPIVELCEAREEPDDGYNMVFPDRWTTWERWTDHEEWTEVKIQHCELVTRRSGAFLRARLSPTGESGSVLTTEVLGIPVLRECRVLDLELRRFQLARTRAAIEHGVRWMLSTVDDEDTPLLHQAIRLGDAGTLEFLLKAGADVDAVDGEGQTPIEVAVRYQQEDAVRLVLEYKPTLPEGILYNARGQCRTIFGMLIDAGASEITNPDYFNDWEVAPKCPYCGNQYVRAWVDEYEYRWTYEWIDDDLCPHIVGWSDCLQHPDDKQPPWTKKDLYAVFGTFGCSANEGVAEIEWTFCDGPCGPGYDGPSNIGDLGTGGHRGTLYFASKPAEVLERARAALAQ